MKGVLAEWIRSMTGGPIQSDSDIVYTNPPSLTDLEDNGLVTKDMLLSSIPGGGPDPISITQGVDLTPMTVPYGDTPSPDYVLINLTGSPNNLIDRQTNVTYFGGNFVIYGATADGTTFADSFLFSIKP